MSLVVIPNTFTPNTTAVSSQVNANFNALANYINSGSGAFSASGYTILPGGLYLQWGSAATVASDGSGATTITFPVTFPTVCFQAIASIDNAYQTTPRALTVQTTALGAGSVQVNVAGGNAAETVSVRWFAVGN